jgi:hypothetical protein
MRLPLRFYPVVVALVSMLSGCPIGADH